ncbi:MAG TPA: hypothetical protein DCG75_06330 [Bacteroidales bacterium]|nr:hypothetical protein [Bacteroidales bacterium]
MKLLLRSVLLISFLLSSLFLYSEHEKPFIINYSKEIYNADNQNWSVSSDNNGILFFANNKGLLEFDGSNWFLHKMPEGGVLRSVFVDKKDRIYIGAYEEFGYWETNTNGEKKYYSLSSSLPKNTFHNDEIWKIDSLNGNIYFQSFSTIFKYDGQKINIIRPESPIVLLLKARNRLFIHVIGKGLYELKNDQLILLPGSEFLANDEIKFVLPYEDDSFLIGACENGILVYNNLTFSNWNAPIAKLILDSEINNGIQLKDNYVIGTITNGVFILGKNGILKHHLNASNFLQNNTVLSLHADSNNNLWIALDRGIDYVEMNSSLDFYIDPFYTIGAVYAAALDNKNLWIGTNKGLYKYVFDENEKNYIDPQLLNGTQGQVLSLNVIDNELLCGHTNGTYSVKEDKIVKISEVKGGYDFEKLNFNNEKILIQSTYSSLVAYKKDIKGWKFSHLIEGFIEPIPDIEQDNFGNIWASHLKKGVFKLQLNDRLDSVHNIKYFNKNQGFINDKEIHISKLENRIVFTNGGLIYTYDDLNDTIIPYHKINQKVEEQIKIKKIIPAKSNLYWFVKDNCISLCRNENENLEQVFSYDLSRQGLYLSTDYPKIIPLNDDCHLICLDNGFALFHFGSKVLSATREKLLMRKVIITNDKGLSKHLPLKSFKEGLLVPFSFRNIQFTFSSTEMSEQPIYRYMLKGLYNEYSLWSNESVVDYKRLPYGKYEFIVQSKTIENIWIDPLIYSFEISPPFYESKLAFIFYILIIIFIIVVGAIILKRRLKKHKVKVEKREQEKREREVLKTQQEYMDLKNKSLQTELYYKNVQLANYAIITGNKNDLLIKIKNNIRKQKNEIKNHIPESFLKKQINLLDQHISNEDEWKTFEGYFDQIHQDFFKKLITQYPDLTQSDLKLCAYLRLNLSSKEIAPLLNISIRGVEARRYRLRKRLNFEHDKNLVEFLLKF